MTTINHSEILANLARIFEVPSENAQVMTDEDLEKLLGKED